MNKNPEYAVRKSAAEADDVKGRGRISKLAVGSVLDDLAAVCGAARLSADVFMATMFAVYSYIEDADFVPGSNVDVAVWTEFKTRIDKCAARLAASRLRREREMALCAAEMESKAAETVVPAEECAVVTGTDLSQRGEAVAESVESEACVVIEEVEVPRQLIDSLTSDVVGRRCDLAGFGRKISICIGVVYGWFAGNGCSGERLDRAASSLIKIVTDRSCAEAGRRRKARDEKRKKKNKGRMPTLLSQTSDLQVIVASSPQSKSGRQMIFSG